MKHTIVRGMKRLLSGFVVTALLITTGAVRPASAAAGSGSESAAYKEEQSRQNEIEAIFEELNERASRETHCKALEVDGIALSGTGQERKAATPSEGELELRLEALGVKKINPEEAEDLSLLYELTPAFGNADVLRSGPTDTAPDFAFLAKAFTIYVYDGTYSYKGESHIYRYIRVIDNKGHGGLCRILKYAAVDNTVLPSAMGSVLSYNFGFVLSHFLGKVPHGLVIDWTLGNIFSLLNGIASDSASNITVYGRENLYEITCNSVTEMVYYFYYDDPVWSFIGTSASVAITYSNLFVGFMGGVPVQENTKPVTWTSTSGGVWYDYVEEYVDSKSYHPGYCRIDELGSYDIKGYEDTSVKFAPKFAALPGDI